MSRVLVLAGARSRNHPPPACVCFGVDGRYCKLGMDYLVKSEGYLKCSGTRMSEVEVQQCSEGSTWRSNETCVSQDCLTEREIPNPKP